MVIEMLQIALIGSLSFVLMYQVLTGIAHIVDAINDYRNRKDL